MADWQYAQCDRAEQLAQITYYSAKKHENGREIEFKITLKEFVSPPPGQHTRFFAEADKKVNQKSVALLPFGWGDSVLGGSGFFSSFLASAGIGAGSLGLGG